MIYIYTYDIYIYDYICIECIFAFTAPANRKPINDCVYKKMCVI